MQPKIYYKRQQLDMLRKQLMFSYSREMYAYHHIKWLWLVLLIFCSSLLTSEAIKNGQARRKSNAKQTIENVTDGGVKSQISPNDQVALPAARSETNHQYRRAASAYSNNGEDYNFGNLEMNLIRPDSEPIRTQITTKYTSSISTHPSAPVSALEDSETAEEYVAKAMQMYGTRLREPIRIPSESEQQEINMQSSTAASISSNSNYNQYYDYLNKQQQQQQQQQQQETATMDNKQVKPQQTQEDANALLEAQMQIQLQAQMLAEKQLETQSEHAPAAPEASTSVAQQPAPVYEKDPVTRSYEVYDENAANDDPQSPVDRYYRTKYLYQPIYKDAANDDESAKHENENIQVSASTEIPKAEIMKQIEKSVMKYMKELEAEGKIVTAPQEPKSYYKVMTASNDEKRSDPAGTTTRPIKYSNPSTNYNSAYSHHSPFTASSSSPSSSGSAAAALPHRYSPPGRHVSHKGPSKQHYQTETDTAYQAPHLSQQDMSDGLAPNVEFIYKIKTHAPLQTATVKTVSKPYTLPLKATYEQFDHSAALKNLEEFDLSHVVTTQDLDDHSTSPASSPQKSNKLYFNSEIYHDINSLPYKVDKSRLNPAAEYRKIKSPSDLLTDFKPYTGYFAEPSSAGSVDTDGESAASNPSSDDGYPIMNPYKYIFKKDATSPNKYEESNAPPSKEQTRSHSKKPHFSSITMQKALEFDSYNPKFNNNPEGYGYQPAYKSQEQRDREHSNGSNNNNKHISRYPSNKRGKRGGAGAGGSQHANVGKKTVRGALVKDLEANLALRPPPK